MNYTEYHIIAQDESSAEILMALLADMGFDTFDHNEKELFAYIPSQNITESLSTTITDLKAQYNFTCTTKIITEKNWNVEWEKNFQPIIVDHKCLIRAPFHKPEGSIKYEIIIEPRMSFGTGHHESTYLMIEEMMHMDFPNKDVCDAGCGTGILAIFASKLGAGNILAIDNNEWAYHNTLDNILLNQSSRHENIKVELGEIDYIRDKDFDIILANINKPIIIENLQMFKNCLRINGCLLISGILTADLQDLINEATKQGFKLSDTRTRGDWVNAKLHF